MRTLQDKSTASSAAAGHVEPARSQFLAHHFGSPRQQFEASKLGIWLFLATEVLLFGGLFCAHAVFRANQQVGVMQVCDELACSQRLAQPGESLARLASRDLR